MKKLLFAAVILISFAACTNQKPAADVAEVEMNGDILPDYSAEIDGKLIVDRFADLRILRYKTESFDQLTLDQKKLVYYLSEAALAGRDMIYDQNYRHNLVIRRTLEAIWNNYQGDRSTQDWKKFEEYTKRVWFSNGIHHHYSTKKFIPKCSNDYFVTLASSISATHLPNEMGAAPEVFISEITNIIYDADLEPKKVNKDAGIDLIAESASNFYAPDITAQDVEAFYADKKSFDPERPISFGLNSKLVKEDGVVSEKVWKLGGMYTKAIERIVYWLDQAVEVAENEIQKDALAKLAVYYRSGDLADFDEYSIAWVKDTESVVDVINGFIEVYGDSKGYRGSFESVVSIRDFDASARMKTLAENVQWFEDNSSIMEEHKKKDVKGVSYKVITAVMEAGDAAPATPVGINLPNANWIRAEHGSKSVSLGNISAAYNDAAGKGVLAEFAHDEEEIKLGKAHSKIASKMHTALHEVVGHASGQINKGVGTPKETMQNYSSTLEEARADLVALYYITDQKLVELGLVETTDVGKAEYNGYIRNGLMSQLRRLELGENIEEDHMRNRQLVAKWAFEKGASNNVIEFVKRDGKTFIEINDYEKLRVLFGDLLREIQRIKSEGDFDAAQALVEGYGVQVDLELHKEVLERYEKLNLAPYSGFVQPQFVPVIANDEIVDIKLEATESYSEQMLRYAKDYSHLPSYN